MYAPQQHHEEDHVTAAAEEAQENEGERTGSETSLMSDLNDSSDLSDYNSSSDSTDSEKRDESNDADRKRKLLSILAFVKDQFNSIQAESSRQTGQVRLR